VVDLAETPAVPPEDPGGDERIGLTIAGALFLLLGFGIGVIANLYVHDTASASGTPFGPWTITPALGPYAWATLAGGVIVGVLGILFLWLARFEARGPLKLPGTAY
jgi:hypothetical protein